MLVKGTSAEVYPETAYIEAARQKGARIAVVNVEKEDPALLGLGKQDWYFEGDAAVIAQDSWACYWKCWGDVRKSLNTLPTR